jgi:hypothetical protein
MSRWGAAALPDLVCPLPRTIDYNEAREAYNAVRKEMPSLTNAAWRREAARRMNVTYDDYLKAWKKPKVVVEPAPVSPVKPFFDERPTPKPSPTPTPKLELTHESARDTFKMIKKEFPLLKDAELRREAARRMSVDYDTFLQAWKRPKGATTALRNKVNDVVNNRTLFPRKTADMSDSALVDVVKVNKVRYPGYTHNCTSTTTAYELRRRGFDVEAVALKKGQPLSDVYHSWGIRAEDHLGLKAARRDFSGSPKLMRMYMQNVERAPWNGPSVNFYKLVDEMMTMPDGARGFISVAWTKNRGSHILNWEKRNGEVYFVDAQSQLHTQVDMWIDRFGDRLEEGYSQAVRVDTLPDPEGVDWLARPHGQGKNRTGQGRNPYQTGKRRKVVYV